MQEVNVAMIRSSDELRQKCPSKSSECCCRKMLAKIPARIILYILSTSGFIVSYLMSYDMNFTLVAMINISANSTTEVQSASGYNWSSRIQSMITGSFYWCYIISQIIGGIATQYFGTKAVFGWSQFLTGMCSLCIPWVADYHYGWVIVLRSIQGFSCGLGWPAIYALFAAWTPFYELSRFMSSFQGLTVGIGLTYPLCGVIIEHFGWRYVFLTTGSLGIMWCIPWYFLAFNTPHEHPRISTEELQYIERYRHVTQKIIKDVPVPWMSIIGSVPVWMITITTFGRIWILYFFIIDGPKYMRYILKFNYQKNGFIMGMPFICSYLTSILFCYAADKLMLRCSLTLVRKVFTGLSQFIPGALTIGLGFIGYNFIVHLSLWFTIIIFLSAAYGGAMANIVDIAPNFAGQVSGICQTIHMTASFLSPIATGLIVTRPILMEQWRIVLIIACCITCITCLIYQIWGTANIQEWNTLEDQPVYNDRSNLQQVKTLN